MSALGIAGCAADDGSGKTPETAESTAQALSKEGPADGARERGPRPPGGPDFLLVAALHELDLTAVQKSSIEAALDKAGPRDRGPKDKAPFALLAAGVRAGKIDSAAVLAKVGDVGPTAEEQAAAASAVQTLHDTLTKDQRRALITAVSEHMDRHGPPGGHPGKDGRPGPDGEHRGPPDGPAGKGGPGPMGFLLHGVDVTDAQREAIGRALEAQKPSEADHAAMKKEAETHHAEMRARLAGFAADTFDAKAFVTPPASAGAHGPKEHIERLVKDLAVIVPLLEPAQREALAAMLEKGPPMAPPPGGRRGEHAR